MKTSIYSLAEKARSLTLNDVTLSEPVLEVCRCLARLLTKQGKSVDIVEGTFELDYIIEDQLDGVLDPDGDEDDHRFVVHYWLESEGFWIDPTADQFNDKLLNDTFRPTKIMRVRGNPRYSPLSREKVTLQ